MARATQGITPPPTEKSLNCDAPCEPLFTPPSPMLGMRPLALLVRSPEFAACREDLIKRMSPDDLETQARPLIAGLASSSLNKYLIIRHDGPAKVADLQLHKIFKAMLDHANLANGTAAVQYVSATVFTCEKIHAGRPATFETLRELGLLWLSEFLYVCTFSLFVAVILFLSLQSEPVEDTHMEMPPSNAVKHSASR